MIFEYWMLFGAAAMGLVHIAAASFTFMAQVGNAYHVGPRDEDIQPTGMAGRMDRALRNYVETFPIFVACVFLVDAADTVGALSYWGSAVYLVGRVLYLPLYAIGIPWLRSFSWNAATLGLAVVGAQLLF